VATALSAGIRQRKESTSRGVLMWAASVQAAVERRSDVSVVQRIFDVEAMWTALDKSKQRRSSQETRRRGRTTMASCRVLRNTEARTGRSNWALRRAMASGTTAAVHGADRGFTFYRAREEGEGRRLLALMAEEVTTALMALSRKK
jgi:hypothetical protein